MSEWYDSVSQWSVMIVQENAATKNVHFYILIQRRKSKSVHGTIEDFADMVIMAVLHVIQF